MWGYDTGQALAENPLGTSAVRTEEPAGAQCELDCHTLPRQIRYRTGIVAMHTTRWGVAARTSCGRLSRFCDQDGQRIRRGKARYGECLLVSTQQCYVH